jgi:hypothetical protein
MISYMISYMIIDLISDIILQVDDAEKALKKKIRPRNAFLSCYKFDILAALPREELHQFLIGLYGEYIIPSAFYSITSVLRKPEFILSTNARGVHKYLVINEMLDKVWVRLPPYRQPHLKRAKPRSSFPHTHHTPHTTHGRVRLPPSPPTHRHRSSRLAGTEPGPRSPVITGLVNVAP